MRTASLVAAALGLAAAPLAAQQTPPAGEESQERVHVVQKGETLWDIARQYLNDPFLWPEIFRINTRTVEDPALIYPNERLVLPGARQPGPVAAGTAPGRTVFFPAETGRGGPSYRGADEAPVPAITPGDFYGASFVAQPSEVQPVGTIAEVQQASVFAGEVRPQIMPYSKVFVPLSSPGSVRLGDRLHFVRPEAEVEGYGRVYRSTGMGTVAALDGSTATVVMTDLFDRADVADLALPVAPFPVTPGVRPVEGAGAEGQILAFPSPHVVATTYSVVFLDVGRGAGVQEGDEFVAYLPQEQASWGTRPETRVARLRVVRVMDRTASVKVTGLDQPAVRVGLPVRRVARMP